MLKIFGIKSLLSAKYYDLVPKPQKNLRDNSLEIFNKMQ
ncbi:SLEI motif protein [Leptospira interrogans]|uniref:SLEI motif protein n=3 Tax=Leptospira interrogans TaxID=173 RepID=A0AAP9WEY0_LEPIR|nr:SLEI motif protein [Leptospira interrogans serovar Copenhageni]EKR27912.1 SLEI domain protein, PF07620 family [Leptospira interrogans serovar Bataviae str. L1111]EMF44376.1 SLEI domain protein, PF07620 family [Leptospira interrogans serovar Lora str. TE 1992]EMJ53459.1 SLEI domain protein, PF07620 family [Leptospira interrogans str. UT126]EMN09963.1 SLEI domain protein, PF07620 family [Leptospira interrogans serovar Muenchen str. Brem 129]EMN53347.1 SLEI domain protein, PF07620 family [Lept